MLILLRFCLFMLSMSGSVWYLICRFRIRAEFAPALVCAWTSTLLFLAGCLNLLPETALLLFIGGLLLLAVCFFQKYPVSVGRRIWMLYAAGFCAALYFFLFLRKAHFTSYDNFSHWATVVKDMLLENRMPNFQDTMIRFQSYPLGSSLWIYYVCRIVGITDGCMLWAQVMLLFSLLFCMTAFLHKANWYGCLLVSAFGIWACLANNSIYELRVDTLLSAAGIAAFAVLYVYRHDPKKALYACCGIFILLIQIKNSGVFFYIICLLFFAVSCRKEWKQHLRCFAAFGLAAPLFTLYLWKKHVAFAFTAGMDAKHSMNLAHFGEMAAKKSQKDILSIGKNILRRFGEFKNIEVMLLVLLTVFLLVFAALFLFLLKNRRQAARMLRLLAANLCCVALYTVSLYAMYVFSMPMGESARLASYDRYMLSVLVFLYGITIIVVIDTFRLSLPFANGASAAAFAFFAGLLIYQASPRLSLLYELPEFTHSKRFALQQLLREHGVSQGDTCALYCNGSDDDKRYLFYLLRYELWTNEILVMRGEELMEHTQEIADFDHLIVWDYDARIREFL